VACWSARRRRASFAIAEQNPINLTGALLQLEPARLTIVATDRHRLARGAPRRSTFPPWRNLSRFSLPWSALTPGRRAAEG
jgi:DNA polymerase III sliding clamp (beta) subunit (PCNA family)